jgi:hypothetical protein
MGRVAVTAEVFTDLLEQAYEVRVVRHDECCLTLRLRASPHSDLVRVIEIQAVWHNDSTAGLYFDLVNE